MKDKVACWSQCSEAGIAGPKIQESQLESPNISIQHCSATSHYHNRFALETLDGEDEYETCLGKLSFRDGLPDNDSPEGLRQPGQARFV